MKLVTVTQMRDIEKEADASGLTYDQMMQNAGNGLADVVNSFATEEDGGDEVLGLVGPGNNGGDTLVALTRLAKNGWKARAYLVKRVKKDPLVGALTKAGGEATLADDDKDSSTLASLLESCDMLLDGLLGTGIQLPLKAEIAKILDRAALIMADMETPPFIIAVDCPSGVDCDTGKVADETLRADLTVTMAAVKRGMLKLPAYEFVGELAMAEIGLSDDIAAFNKVQDEVADDDLVAGLLPERPLDSHKGTFGTAFITAGSINYTGAALLAGKAAYRVGAGLVTMAVPAPLHGALAGQFPEATWILLPHELGVISDGAAEVLVKSLERAAALLVGPGFGVEEKTKIFLENLLKGSSSPSRKTSHIGFVQMEDAAASPGANALPPMVVDADGLRLLAKISDWHKLLPAPAVLTPHPGEMSALTGLSKDEIQNAREDAAKKFAKAWGHVVVLKGAFTVIAAPDGRSCMIPVASPALARAGSGDVLAGLIVGLRAQGLDAYDSAIAGAWIHARAGLCAADDLGTSASVLAGDLLDTISDVMSELE